MPVVFSGVVRPVGGDTVDGQQRPVEDHERLATRRLDGSSQIRRAGRKDLDGFGHVPVRRSGSDVKTGGELGVGVSAPQMGQYEQGLPTRWEPAPPRSSLARSRDQQVGQEPQGGAGQVDTRWVDKHMRLRLGRLLLVDNPSTRSFTPSRT
ncbi:hypothetical protein GCM10010320_79910 [Streptomyces caelestis]|uniref:Uncharacterized protein n=1 Tax=Streptomyces caelestis TaxID=36816 RepID=A0A7W9HAJ9_9ACTN|nr:hypothetical protein [Streptomyces caelestis]GGW86207.1 hypothetical protein GCM10010320_79910 [Streptomyces caelestis]